MSAAPTEPGDDADAPSGSRLIRTYRLARLATDTSARFALGAAKRAVGGGDKVDLDEHRKVAGRIVEILGGMKGLAMKAGQIVSYVDDWIPEDVRPTYRSVLSRLQAKAPRVPLADMLNVFVDEVGAPPDEVFRRFDEDPIAAASIGQVYRAELPSGEPVAVKIQYPGMDRAIESDLKNLNLLEAVLRASTMGRFDVSRSLEDIRLKITEELDYAQEARNQARFVDLFAGHPAIVIPRVYPELSRRRVLTTALLQGRTYQELCAAPQEERDRAGVTLYEFVFGTFHRHGLFNADPHPGNYVFLPGDRVGFLDFGCVQPFAREVADNFRDIIRLFWAGDLAAMRERLPHALGYPGQASDEEKDFFLDYLTCLWRPIAEDRPFRYTDEYTREVFRRTYDGARLGVKVTIAKGYPDTERRGLGLLNRLQFGFASVMAGLGAEANWRAMIGRFFDDTDRVPAA